LEFSNLGDGQPDRLDPPLIPERTFHRSEVELLLPLTFAVELLFLGAKRPGHVKSIYRMHRPVPTSGLKLTLTLTQP